jgi:hypothetical protein
VDVDKEVLEEVELCEVEVDCEVELVDVDKLVVEILVLDDVELILVLVDCEVDECDVEL